MTTLEQKIVKYRTIELAANTVLHGSGKLTPEQKAGYRKVLHDARIKRMSLQLEIIDKMDDKHIDKEKEPRKISGLFINNNETKESVVNEFNEKPALEEATKSLHEQS